MKSFFLSILKTPYYLWHYWNDFRRYLRFSSTLRIPRLDQENFSNLIAATYHSLEKGLSFKKPEINFGHGKALNLTELLRLYIKNGFKLNDTHFLTGISTLDNFCRQQELFCHDKNINNDLRYFKKKVEFIHQSSTKSLKKETILDNTNKGFESFMFSRHSIREFTSQPVDLILIKKAIYIAQQAPSVCNRQTARVYTVQDPERKKKVLKCQSGNRGFGYRADKLLIITSEIRGFIGINERNQPFIDGGIFAMSLILALHAQGLGVCPLNWAASLAADKALRQIAPIGQSEVVILILAVGHLPDQITVTRSARKKVDEVHTLV